MDLVGRQIGVDGRHSVVGRVEDVRIVQLAHRLEFREHATDLDVNVLTTGKLPAELVSDLVSAGLAVKLPEAGQVTVTATETAAATTEEP